MAQIIITVQDAQVNRVLLAYSNALGYSPTLPPNNTPNPETRALFVWRMVGEHIKRTAAEWEAREASIAAANKALGEIVTG